MLYYLTAILLGPIAAEISERSKSDIVPLIAGITVSATALLSLTAWSGVQALTVAVLGVGIGHALMRAPLLDLAIGFAGGSVKAIGLVRTSERLGAMIALAIAAFFATGAASWTLPAILGIVAAAGGLILGVMPTMTFHRKRS
jgi:hypothetical protein